MKKFPVAAGIALALVAGSALAADLPSMKAPPAYIPPPPVMSWNGLYGGVNIGYGFGQTLTENGGYNYFGPSFTGAAVVANPRSGYWAGDQSLNGVLGGGQVGYNWQFSPWLVLGFEADIQAADIGSTRDYVGPATFGYTAVNSSLNVDWFGTARGRVGFVMPSWPNLMVYGTGGFAYGQVVQQTSITNVVPGGGINGKSTYDTTATGWAAGGGVEWMPLPAWSLKLEYLYTDLGSYSQTFAGVNRIGGAINPDAVMTGANNGSVRWHTVRAGLNWHFNPFASAPILAKY